MRSKDSQNGYMSTRRVRRAARHTLGHHCPTPSGCPRDRTPCSRRGSRRRCGAPRQGPACIESDHVVGQPRRHRAPSLQEAGELLERRWRRPTATATASVDAAATREHRRRVVGERAVWYIRCAAVIALRRLRWPRAAPAAVVARQPCSSWKRSSAAGSGGGGGASGERQPAEGTRVGPLAAAARAHRVAREVARVGGRQWRAGRPPLATAPCRSGRAAGTPARLVLLYAARGVGDVGEVDGRCCGGGAFRRHVGGVPCGEELRVGRGRSLAVNAATMIDSQSGPPPNVRRKSELEVRA